MRIANAPSAPTPTLTTGRPWQPARARRGTQTWKAIRRDWRLYAMLALPALYIIVFKYWPMYGIQIAFRNFNPIDGITGSPWVGLAHFERFVTSYSFRQVIGNTLLLSAYSLAAGFPLPIILALALNYTGRAWFRRTVQMTGYAPFFISLLQNPINLPVSEVIDTYVYHVGLAGQLPQFSYAAAIGLFQSVIAMILIVAVNQIAKKVSGASLW